MKLIDFIKYIAVETNIVIEDVNHNYICDVRRDKAMTCPQKYLDCHVKVAYVSCYEELNIILEEV